MDGGGAARGAYQRVRERLVSLTVELEDAERSAGLLDEALDRVRGESKGELEQLAAEMRAALEDRQATDKKDLSGVVERCDALLTEKRKLASAFKAAADALQRQSNATSAAVALVKDQGQAELAAAHKTWREGEASRRARFLQRKADDAKATTLKGLEPEMAALATKHQRALDDLNTASEHSLTAATSCAEQEQKQKATATRDAANEAQTRKVDSEGKAFRSRVDQLNKQHAERLRAANQVFSKELDSTRLQLACEMRSLREPHSAAMARHRVDEERRLEGLRQQHASELARLDRCHSRDFQQLEADATSHARSWAQHVKKKLLKGFAHLCQGQGDVEGDDASGSGGGQHNESSTQSHNQLSVSGAALDAYAEERIQKARGGGAVTEQGFLGPDFLSAQTSTSTHKNNGNGDRGGSGGGGGNSEEKEHHEWRGLGVAVERGLGVGSSDLVEARRFQASVQGVRKKRDQGIERVMKRVEEEQVAKEAEVRRSHAVEEAFLVEAHESSVCALRQARVEAASKERQLQQELNELEAELKGSTAKELELRKAEEQVRKEFAALELEEAQAAECLKEACLCLERDESEADAQSADAVAQLLLEAARFDKEVEESLREHSERLGSLSSNHESELQALHGRVKATVEARGDELSALNEALEVEEARSSTLNQLISKARAPPHHQRQSHDDDDDAHSDGGGGGSVGDRRGAGGGGGGSASLSVAATVAAAGLAGRRATVAAAAARGAAEETTAATAAAAARRRQQHHRSGGPAAASGSSGSSAPNVLGPAAVNRAKKRGEGGGGGGGGGSGCSRSSNGTRTAAPPSPPRTKTLSAPQSSRRTNAPSAAAATAESAASVDGTGSASSAGDGRGAGRLGVKMEKGGPRPSSSSAASSGSATASRSTATTTRLIGGGSSWLYGRGTAK